MNSVHPQIVLHVEDDPADRELTRRAFEKAPGATDLREAADGKEALDYLYHQGRYCDPDSSPRPHLILLDINMPKVDGRQVLERIRRCRSLARIPVVLLTTSQAEEDVIRGYELGCKSYVQKPEAVDEFIDTIRRIHRYWFETVTLPPAA